MNTPYRNPAKIILQQLTPQLIKQFDRDQVIRKLGLNEALTPQDREQCQLIISLLRERLAVINESIKQKKTVKIGSFLPNNTKETITDSKKTSLLFVEKQLPVGKQPLLLTVELPSPFIVQQIIVEKPISVVKQSLKTNKDVLQQGLLSQKDDKHAQEKIDLSQSFSIIESIGSKLQESQNKGNQTMFSSPSEEDEQDRSLLSHRNQSQKFIYQTLPTKYKIKLD